MGGPGINSSSGTISDPWFENQLAAGSLHYPDVKLPQIPLSGAIRRHSGPHQLPLPASQLLRLQPQPHPGPWAQCSVRPSGPGVEVKRISILSLSLPLTHSLIVPLLYSFLSLLLPHALEIPPGEPPYPSKPQMNEWSRKRTREYSEIATNVEISQC